MECRLPGEYPDFTSYTTGDPTSDNLCVVEVDSLGIVITIIVISSNVILTRNLSCLVGLHESYLNGAIFAYESGHVTDWIHFFNKDWITAICLDKFRKFSNNFKKYLESDEGVQFFIQSAVDIAEGTDEDAIIVGERRRIIGDRGAYIPNGTKKTIESQTIDYLRTNKALLPKFRIPNSHNESKSNLNKK